MIPTKSLNDGSFNSKMQINNMRTNREIKDYKGSPRLEGESWSFHISCSYEGRNVTVVGYGNKSSQAKEDACTKLIDMINLIKVSGLKSPDGVTTEQLLTPSSIMTYNPMFSLPPASSVETDQLSLISRTIGERSYSEDFITKLREYRTLHNYEGLEIVHCVGKVLGCTTKSFNNSLKSGLYLSELTSPEKIRPSDISLLVDLDQIDNEHRQYHLFISIGIFFLKIRDSRYIVICFEKDDDELRNVSRYLGTLLNKS